MTDLQPCYPRFGFAQGSWIAMKLRSTFWHIAAPVLVLSLPLFGQNPRGSLRGVIQDSTGARIQSATIVVRATESSIQRETASESHGEFRIDDLAPGSYDLMVDAQGFAQAKANLAVQVSAVREIMVTLRPATSGDYDWRCEVPIESPGLRAGLSLPDIISKHCGLELTAFAPATCTR